MLTLKLIHYVEKGPERLGTGKASSLVEVEVDLTNSCSAGSEQHSNWTSQSGS